MAKLNRDLGFRPDRVRARQSVSVQYQDDKNRWFGVQLGVDDAMYLMGPAQTICDRSARETMAMILAKQQ